MRTIVVGTRKSELAVTQTLEVIGHLKKICMQKNLPYDFTMKKVVTKGDRILHKTLSKVGGKGLFVKEIEQALLNHEIDIAVHSMKDVPAELPAGLVIGAVSKREDARDCLISAAGLPLSELPPGASIGTSSLRRSSQILALRPDVQIAFIRGNINTRLGKLDAREFDAIVLAAAGLHRMGWKERITEYLSPEICLPAVGQGALGVECREDDGQMRELLELFNDQQTELAVTAERSFLGRLNGGCQVPIGAYAEVTEAAGQVIRLTGMVGSANGTTIIKHTLEGSDPQQIGTELAEVLLKQGAERILSGVRR